MKKSILLLMTLIGIITGSSLQAQTWELVWADEFTNEISPDWVFELGNGSNGWGNRELQFYRRENATIENGMLVITARRENMSGFNYTSARMKTQGRKSWKYGKMEARIKLPAVQGTWPAFWMLGDNITSVGWPACGEIDIMEQVNTDQEVHGTIHWQDHNNRYANFGGKKATDVTEFHIYSIEWNPTSIRWFLDGVQYHVVNIANGINGTSEFHEKQFLLLNMAIGGNWPGFTINNEAFPVQMLVDYVRVYRDTELQAVEPTRYDVPGKIRAEHFADMSGVQTEPTTDTGGGNNVGYIDGDDWMDYLVDVKTAGTYAVNIRVASQPGGGTLQLRSGSEVLASVNIAATGGWQQWSTVSTSAVLPAGEQTLRLHASTGGFNINWIEFTAVATSLQTSREASAKVELFPNPAQRELVLKSELILQGEQVSITDLTGKVLYQSYIDNKPLNIAELLPGFYVLTITHPDGNINKRFIKQ
jgi:beta-glucanase (GH16 family)